MAASLNLRRIAFTMIVSLVSAALPAPRHSGRAQEVRPVRTSAITPNGWEFIDVAHEGQNGFTIVHGARIGPNDAVLVRGVRNGRAGFFIVDNGAVTEVASTGTTFSNTVISEIDVQSVFDDYAFLPNGSVVFAANVQIGGAPATAAVLLWKNGVLTVAAPTNGFTGQPGLSNLNTHFPAMFTADGRWLVTTQLPTTYKTTRYGLTDGIHTSYLLTFTEQADNTIDPQTVSVSPAGEIIYVEHTCHEIEFLHTGCNWTMKAISAAERSLFSATYAINRGNKAGSIADGPTLGNIANIAAVRLTDWNEDEPFPRCDPQQMLWAFEIDYAAPMAIAAPSCPADPLHYSGSLTPLSFGPDKLVYQAMIVGEADRSPKEVLADGLDLTADRILEQGQSPLGEAVERFYVQRQYAFRTDAAFAAQFSYAGNVDAIVLIRKIFPRWINPAGGAWGAGSNWNTNLVPGFDDAIQFDLDAIYAVDVGVQQIRDIRVSKGDVTLNNAMLTITDTKNSDRSNVLQIEGVDGTTPRLTIAGSRRSITDVTLSEITGTVLVGSFTGPGELRIQDAIVWQQEDFSEGVVGLFEPATATVTGNGAAWLMDHLSIGVSNTAKLRIEDCGKVGFSAENAYVGGGILGDLPSRHTAYLEVVGADRCFTWLGPVYELTIGRATLADVSITNGGSILATTTTVAALDHGAATDAVITIDGASVNEPSALETGDHGSGIGGLFVSEAPGTNAIIQVSGGGLISATRLSLADAAGSSATLFVDGFEGGATSGRRSSVFVPIAPITNKPGAPVRPDATDPLIRGDCVIGRGGTGTLEVTSGAQVRCRQLAVGYEPGSTGEVRIEGSTDTAGSAVFVDGPGLFDGLVCIGADASCGGAGGGQHGSVIIGKDGGLMANAIGIGSGGRLLGSGYVFVRDGILLAGGGSLSPGLKVVNAAGRGSSETDTVGTLTIEGDVVISSTGVVSLQVNGVTPELQDRLVVTGSVDMRGTMALTFGNGYAPKAGDTFPLIQADVVTDAAKSIVISGLAEGFQYSVAPSADGLVLTALNDGAPESAAGGFGIYVPLLVR